MSLWKICVQSPLRMFCHRPTSPTRAIASQLPLDWPIEEENTPYYDTKHFYPARLGQVLLERYQLSTKLGYGTGSTVWLAQDLHRWRWSKKEFVAIKIASSRAAPHAHSVNHECEVHKHIASANPNHRGWHFVRHLKDSFILNGKSGEHVCLVFDALREPLWLYCRRFVNSVIPADILPIIIMMMLEGLDYLHSECHLVHTDLKPDNIMVKIEDPNILEKDSEDEYNNPLPQKQIDGRTIYLSRNNYGQLRKPTGTIRITDFDRAVFGEEPQSGAIQAEIYRAPEVTFGAGYSYPADIWSLGVMLWDLLEGKALFEDAFDRKSQEINESQHIAMITALLGPPPGALLQAQRANMFYHQDGTPKEKTQIPKGFCFESTIHQINGREREMFVAFVKRMIRWDPRERSTARELLQDPWLKSALSQK